MLPIKAKWKGKGAHMKVKWGGAVERKMLNNTGESHRPQRHTICIRRCDVHESTTRCCRSSKVLYTCTTQYSTCAISLWKRCWNCSRAQLMQSKKLLGLLESSDSDILFMQQHYATVVDRYRVHHHAPPSRQHSTNTEAARVSSSPCIPSHHISNRDAFNWSH